MDYAEKLIIAKFLQEDLKEIDSYLEKNGVSALLSVVLIKQSFISISNLVDFEVTIRAIYKRHRNLSRLIKSTDKEFKFAKYLRNIYTGHLNEKLIAKALVWRPELNSIGSCCEKSYIYFFNMCVLETAVNTYVDSEGKHRVFGSEIDLFYPPDKEKFLAYLTLVIKSGIEYLDALSKVLSTYVKMTKEEPINFRRWIIAGETKFEYIKK